MAEGARDNIDYRKKRRKRIKTIIVAFILFLLVFPIIFCLFLLFRMNRMERQIETLIAERGIEEDHSTAVPDVVKAEGKETVVSEPAIEEEKSKKVYLTFEDGPSEETEKILDILKKKKIKATFFVIGREDEYSKKIYKRIVKEGHTLGMHSYSHIYKEIYESEKLFEKDFQKISDHLFEVTGVRPSYYRFPGGSTSIGSLSIEQCREFLDSQGVTYLDWNVIAANYVDEDVSKAQMVQSVMDGVSAYDTSIVLLYDSADKQMTAKSLGTIIDDLQAGGYEILPVDENTTPVHHS